MHYFFRKEQSLLVTSNYLKHVFVKFVKLVYSHLLTRHDENCVKWDSLNQIYSSHRALTDTHWISYKAISIGRIKI